MAITWRNPMVSMLALAGAAAVSVCKASVGGRPVGPGGRFRFPQGRASGDPPISDGTYDLAMTTAHVPSKKVR